MSFDYSFNKKGGKWKIEFRKITFKPFKSWKTSALWGLVIFGFCWILVPIIAGLCMALGIVALFAGLLGKLEEVEVVEEQPAETKPEADGPSLEKGAVVLDKLLKD